MPAPTRRLLTLIASLLVMSVVVAGCVGVVESSESEPSEPSTGPAPVIESSGEAQGPIRHVHLGDSYASGTGVLPPVEDSPFFCVRSTKNFGALLAERFGHDYTDVSCASATTQHFTTSQFEGVGPQLDALTPDTDLVTLMIGGNNHNVFGGTVAKCSAASRQDPDGSPCVDRYGTTLTDPIERQTRDDVVQALRLVTERAPRARVIVVGYPWILPATEGCYPNMAIAAGDVAFLRDMQESLNEVIERAADETGATFIDMAQVSEGHDACQPADVRWIEPMTDPESPNRSRFAGVHPNAVGQEAIAAQVAAVIDG